MEENVKLFETDEEVLVSETEGKKFKKQSNAGFVNKI